MHLSARHKHLSLAAAADAAAAGSTRYPAQRHQTVPLSVHPFQRLHHAAGLCRRHPDVRGEGDVTHHGYGDVDKLVLGPGPRVRGLDERGGVGGVGVGGGVGGEGGGGGGGGCGGVGRLEPRPSHLPPVAWKSGILGSHVGKGRGCAGGKGEVEERERERGGGGAGMFLFW